MEIGFLASGNLGLLVFQELIKYFRINFVLTDSASTAISELCKSKSIPFYAGNPRKGKALQKLTNINCEVIVSVNYLFLIEEDIIKLPSKIAINFHGSLLPRYRGRTPHVWAIINNENETGITAHVIDQHCDTGDIIAQRKLTINREDTGASILEKFSSLYPGFVIEVLHTIQASSVSFTPQDNSLATYFGKRTPEDGKINWDWQRERIFNWVRALAKPYPGAFTIYQERKLIINKIQFSTFGFHYDIPNGTIVGFNQNTPVVKTPNGCIELLEIESSDQLKINEVLH